MTLLKRTIQTILVCFLMCGLLLAPAAALAEGEPADPDQPNVEQPVDPTNPADPTDPADPADPTDPADSDDLDEIDDPESLLVPEGESSMQSNMMIAPLMLVDVVQDMLNDIAGLAGADETYEISDAFVANFNSRTQTVALPALAAGQTVTIDGQNKTLGAIGAKHFTIDSGNLGTYVFKNLVLNGSPSAGVVGAGGIVVCGNVEILNCLVQNISGTALPVAASNSTLTIEDSSFVGNTNAGSGAVISLTSANANATITATRAYFKDNTITGLNARGAAIYIYNAPNASLTLDSCVFENNTTPGLAQRNDGGAISFTMDNVALANTPGSFSITRSTFSNNACGDDGSALLLEGHTTGTETRNSLSGKIENTTFIGNVAAGFDNKVTLPIIGTVEVGSPGGTISIYARATLDLTNNTFYDNSKTSTGGLTTGAAIGASGTVQGVTATFNYLNNLFVGNTVPNNSGASEARANVSGGVDLGGNVNLGASATQDIFNSVPTLENNGCPIKVGYSESANTTLQSLLIAPQLEAANTAHNAGAASAAQPAEDKRGQTRSITNDSGAVDIKAAYFDANGGQWDTSAHPGYSYAAPVVFSASEDKAAAVAPLNSATLPAPYTAQISHTDPTLEPIGWHTDSAATTALYALGATDIPVPLSGETYYVVWAPRAVYHTVAFDSQGGSAIGPLSNVAAGSTIRDPGVPARSGYTFKGWYKEAAGVNAWDFANDTVNSDITLFAKWEPVVTSGGSAPDTSDPFNPMLYVLIAAAALVLFGFALKQKNKG